MNNYFKKWSVRFKTSLISAYLESEHPEDEEVVRYPSSADDDPSPSLSLALSAAAATFSLTEAKFELNHYI